MLYSYICLRINFLHAFFSWMCVTPSLCATRVPRGSICHFLSPPSKYQDQCPTWYQDQSAMDTAHLGLVQTAGDGAGLAERCTETSARRRHNAGCQASCMGCMHKSNFNLNLLLSELLPTSYSLNPLITTHGQKLNYSPTSNWPLTL